MNTEQLIARLAQNVEPVRPLRSPWQRAAGWLAATAAYLGLITAMMISGDDLAAIGGRLFIVQQVAALIAGATAAAAAFASVVPGYPRRMLYLAATAASLWVVSLIAGALQESPQAMSAAVADQREWRCVAMMIGGGFLPAAAIAAMLRKGVPVTPSATAMLVVLAAAGLANISACLSHPHVSSAATIVWHGGTLLTLLAVAAWAGRAWQYGERRAAR